MGDEKYEKLDKAFTIIAGAICTLLVIFVIFGIIVVRNFLTDYECSQMPPQQFFKEQKCKDYWKYRINDYYYDHKDE